MPKEAKEGVMTAPHQIENISRRIEIIKEPKRNYRIKSIITEMKNSQDGLNNRFEMSEANIKKKKMKMKKTLKMDQ